jgi:flagellar protein FliS
MYNRQAAQAYTNVGLESNAMSASPQQLIGMLFEGAQGALRKASHALERGDIPQRGQALSKAIDIIERGLRASLNTEKGGELAAHLDSLYDYMIRRLMRANLKGDGEAITEVSRLLDEIGTAWKQIGRQ